MKSFYIKKKKMQRKCLNNKILKGKAAFRVILYSFTNEIRVIHYKEKQTNSLPNNKGLGKDFPSILSF